MPRLPPRPTRPTPWIEESTVHESQQMLNANVALTLKSESQLEPYGDVACMTSLHAQPGSWILPTPRPLYIGMSESKDFFNLVIGREFVSCRLVNVFLHRDLDHSDDGRFWICLRCSALCLNPNHKGSSADELAHAGPTSCGPPLNILERLLDCHVTLGIWRFRRSRLREAVRTAASLMEKANGGLYCVCTPDYGRSAQRKYYLHLADPHCPSLDFFHELSRHFQSYASEKWRKRNFHISFVPA